MPQGGVEEGEDFLKAAFRELEEEKMIWNEIGLRNIRLKSLNIVLENRRLDLISFLKFQLNFLIWLEIKLSWDDTCHLKY